MGKMRVYIPYAGFFTIWLNDYPWFKYAVLGMMGFLTIIAKDPQWLQWYCYKRNQYLLFSLVTGYIPKFESEMT